MKLVRIGRFLLVAAFLLAQQSALAHQVWHSAANGGKPAASAEQGKKGNPLCEQHEALGTVLGALSAALPAFVQADSVPLHFAPAHKPRAGSPSLVPVSRGPPAFR